MIKLVALDIDGVLTDGSVMIDSDGKEHKQVSLKDIDAVFELHRRGFQLAAVTGEDTDIVGYFEKRFPWDFFIRGNKKKKEALLRLEQEAGVDRTQVCYAGDGKYDTEPLAYAGLGVCPADAVDQAKQAADVILQTDGGRGCIWELASFLTKYNDRECPHHYFLNRLEEHAGIFKRLASDQPLMDAVMSVLQKTAEATIRALKNGGKVLLCGNGGSAADAQHIATEFVSRFYTERPGLNAEALSVNTSSLTAIGNDYSFERVFARQLEAKARPGDMVIGISTSGSSGNVLEALRYARNNGIFSVLLMGGFENPKLNEAADDLIKVPSLITPRIQEAHIFIGHVMAEYVEHKMFGGGVLE